MKIRSLGIYVLPVAHIENLFILSSVVRALAEIDGPINDRISEHLNDFENKMFKIVDDYMIKKSSF